MLNRISTLEDLQAARDARRREYKRSALQELGRRVGPDFAEVALSLALAAIWDDCFDALFMPISAEEGDGGA